MREHFFYQIEKKWNNIQGKFNFQAYNPANFRATKNCKNKNLSKIYNIACFQIK